MNSPAEVDRLREAILEAGGEAGQPADQLMYEPVYSCSARDSFGTDILIISPQSAKKG